MKRVKSRFTLIEMLAVVAIASILIALITPAVQNLMFGSRVDQCTSNFKLGLEQAQSKAIASRKYVALVLPFNHKNTDSDSKQYNIYCRSGYRMAYVTRDGDNYNFDRWVENQDWKNPNAGALCMDITTDSPDDDETSWANDVKDDMRDLQQDKGFNVLSDLKNITNTPELKGITKDGSSDGKYCAVIFSPYGGIVNNERPLYFTFTEAKTGSGNKYELDNVDNFLVLKLNAITGQVTYFDPYDDKADE